MSIGKANLVALAFAITIVTAASPGSARPLHDGVSAARAAAIHECTARASQYKEYTFGNMEFDQYRGCMAEHGQRE
jgi:hypothetical protein